MADVKKAGSGKPQTDASKKKTECAISRAEFNDKAKPILLKGVYDGAGANPQEFSLALAPGDFSTGSFGWKTAGEKATLVINGKTVRIQLGINLTVVGSKEVG